MFQILSFFMLIPTFVLGSGCGEEILCTARTMICKRTIDHPWVNMSGNIVPYSSDPQKLMKNAGHFFSIYDVKDPKNLISTVNFFQWPPIKNIFECTIAVHHSYQSKGYGTEISVALIDYILGRYPPCIIVEERDPNTHNNTSKILKDKLSYFGTKDEYWYGYWCATPDLAQFSYREAINALGLSKDHPFHPKYWDIVARKS